jgi:HD-GYP domain-containing protein (c-di-GMP phosphodiesterase class II)
LKADDIPLLPRIIAVADTFDALTTNRPYQHARSSEDALKVIRSLSGKRLDQAAVTALETVYARGEIVVPQAATPAMAAAAAANSSGAVDSNLGPEQL